MLFKSNKSTAIVVFLSLIFTSISCGSSETNKKQNESEESAAFLPVAWYVLVVASTGLTIRKNIRTHDACMKIRASVINEHPQYASNLVCKSM